MSTVFRRLCTFEDDRWKKTLKRLKKRNISYTTEFFKGVGVSIVVSMCPDVYQRFLNHLNFKIIEVFE